MKLTLMAQNLSRGGLHNAQGEYQDRWPQLAERIKEVDPDLLLLSELNNWKDYGYKQYVRAANDLGLDIAPAAPSETGYATGLMYRREKLGHWRFHNDSLSHATTHGFAVTGFDVGLPMLLNIAPVHLCFYSAQKAAQEAQLVISKVYKDTSFAIIGGDCNFSPAEGRDPDYSRSKPYNFSARTIIDTAEEVPVADLRADRQMAWTLVRGGFVDVAHHLYRKTNDEKLLQPTTNNDERIDQFWVSKAIAPALEHYEQTDKNPKATDHPGIVIEIDTEKVDTQRMWEPEKL